MNSIFWVNSPYVLISGFHEFIPTPAMSDIEKMNALTRFMIYFALLVCICGMPFYWLIVPFFAILIVLIVYYNLFAEKFDPITELGFIDSNGDIKFNRTQSDVQHPSQTDLTYSCRPPTDDNPFMNPSINDCNAKQENPVPCNIDDDNISDDVKRSFNRNLYLNASDTFERENSQRQFYTIPSPTIPNNQELFAKWLYNIPATCKEKQAKCLRYEDIRYNR